MTFVPTENDFIMHWDDEHSFSFFESEAGEIFSYGHRDPIELVSEVREYDVLTSGDESFVDYSYDDLIPYVRHTWAVISSSEEEEEWRFSYGVKYEGSAGAFPITHIVR